MTDNTRLNPGTLGDLIALDDVTDGGVANLAKVQRIKPGFGTDGNYTDPSKATPFPTDGGAISPQTSFGSAIVLAAGVAGDLDSAQIATSKKGHLMELIIASTVYVKAEIKTVTNAVETGVLATLLAAPGFPPWRVPSKDFFTVSHDTGAGLDAFRITVTNLDPLSAADIHITMLYDEV